MSLSYQHGKGVCVWALCLSGRNVFTKQTIQTETICQEQMWEADSREIATINSVP